MRAAVWFPLQLESNNEWLGKSVPIPRKCFHSAGPTRASRAGFTSRLGRVPSSQYSLPHGNGTSLNSNTSGIGSTLLGVS